MELGKATKRRPQDDICTGCGHFKKRAFDSPWYFSQKASVLQTNKVAIGERHQVDSHLTEDASITGICGCEPPTVPVPAVPTLPPSVREAERMRFVQRWVDDISKTVPLWAQTSVNRIVPLSNPKQLPDEESDLPNKDTHCTKRSTGYQYPQTQHVTTYQSHGSMAGLQLQRNPEQQPVPTDCNGYARDETNALQSMPIGVNPRISSVVVTSAVVAGPPRALRQTNPPYLIDTEDSNQEDSDVHYHNYYKHGSTNRFFNDLETKLVVMVFNDFFKGGSCPSLSEVRRRIVNTVLQDRRNATSIRAKVKRLQSSGRWVDYAVS